MEIENCLFCKIVKGEIPANKVYEDAHTLAFHDINPQAPIHILVIPLEHYSGIHEIPDNNNTILKCLFKTVSTVVKQENLTTDGYRLVINSGENGGQLVPHIHVHILGGRSLHWPPG